MPVLGHAFVGLATAFLFVTPCSSNQNAIKSTFWLPGFVFLAYLPDVFFELFQSFGWQSARLFSHSIAFAVPASLVVHRPLSKLGYFSSRRAFGLSLASILIHDSLDLLQHTDRAPLWPIITEQVAIPWVILPSDPYIEALLFGLLCTPFFILHSIRLKRFRLRDGGTTSAQGAHSHRWIAGGLILAIATTAVVTHYLREARGKDLRQAHLFLRKHDYQAVIIKASEAERWPSPAKPGRIDYLRAIAYDKLGDRKAAEHYYLRSYDADPNYFWCVADLALFYAKADIPPPDRRRIVAPYLKLLKTKFPEHRDFREYLEAIETALTM